MGVFDRSSSCNFQPDADCCMELYRIMLRIRRAEEKIVEIYPSDKIQSPVHLSIGQEAVSAGVCYALRPEDRVYGTYRGHGLFIAKGGDLKSMFAELYGKDTGCARGRGGSMHLLAPEVGLMGCSAIVASMVPVATGDALASQMRGRPYVVLAFFGDGAVDEGIFFESLNFAALKSLPIVYVCENNGLAIHSRISDRHRKTEIYRYVEGLGIPGYRFDGNDAGLVYSTTAQAVQRVRDTDGPLFLEYMTCRHYEHVGPGTDLDADYRDPMDLAQAADNDPLKRAKWILQERFGVPQAWFEEQERWAQGEVEEAALFAEQSPFPEPAGLCGDLFELER